MQNPNYTKFNFKGHPRVITTAQIAPIKPGTIGNPPRYYGPIINKKSQRKRFHPFHRKKGGTYTKKLKKRNKTKRRYGRK